MRAIVFSLLFLVGISFGKDIKVERIDDITFEKPKAQPKTQTQEQIQTKPQEQPKQQEQPQSQPQEQTKSILDYPISINVRNVPLTYLTSLISNEIGVPIVYRSIGLQTLSGTTSGNQSAQSEMFTVSYVSVNKPLYQVLDELTSMVDLYWEYKDGKIVIYQFKSATFRLSIPWLTQSIETKDGDISLSYKKDILASIQNSLQALLFNKNSKISVDQSGFVFAYATRQEMDSIKNAIDRINKTFTTSIPLNIGVYLISDDNFRELGVNWGYSNYVGSGLTGSTNLIGGMVSPGGTLPNGSTVGTIFNLSVVGSKFNIQLQALEQKGLAYRLESNYLQALNGQPVVWKPQTQTTIVSNYQLSYIAASTGNTSATTTTVPTVTTQTQNINTGEELILVPYFIDSENSKIAVQVYRQKSDLQNLQYQNINLAGFANQIALPTIRTNTNINQTILEKGQTLVLFSNTQTLKQIQQSGIPFLSNIPILGHLFKTENVNNTLYRVIITLSYE